MTGQESVLAGSLSWEMEMLPFSLMAYKRDNPGIAHSSLATNLLNLVRFAENVNKPLLI
jgi:hypothetical protein